MWVASGTSHVPGVAHEETTHFLVWIFMNFEDDKPKKEDEATDY